MKDILIALDRIVGGSTYWGWKINWGCQPWQLRTYRQQKRLTLQAGWEDRVDFGLDLYRSTSTVPQRIPTPVPTPEVLTLVNLNALETEETKLDPIIGICETGFIQHERPVVFHEIITTNSSSSSDIENSNREQELPVVEEDSDLDSMPELEDETNLDSIEIPLWLIPNGVIVAF